MATTIRVQMLGGLRVTAAGEELIAPEEQVGKHWQLFCFVLLNQDAPCTVSRLTANLWRGVAPADPQKTLLLTLDALDREFSGTESAKTAPILFADGQFRPNPALRYELDTQAFEQSCQKAAKAAGDKQLTLYRKAAGLYTGGLLPKLDGEIWIAPLARYFATLYLQCVTALCEGLEKERKYTQLLPTAMAAAGLEPLEERYQLYIFRALQAMGMSRIIIPTYHRTARTFMEELGMPLNEEIQTIYSRASGQVDSVEQDMLIVRDDLSEGFKGNRPGSGPLFCSYDVFSYLYQMVSRSSERAGRKVAVLLLTLQPVAEEADSLTPRAVSTRMQQLRTVVLPGLLRRSDTVARFAQNQYLIMLSVDSREGAELVLDRLCERCAALLDGSGMQARFDMVDTEPAAS